jgi:hypothetical protein
MTFSTFPKPLSIGDIAAHWLAIRSIPHHEGRALTHGYEPTREAAMANPLRIAGGDINRLVQ